MRATHLIFDCDGVIVDSEIMATRIALEFLADYGYHNDEESHCRRFSGMMDTEILAIIFDELGQPQPEDAYPRLRQIFDRRFQEELQPIAGMPAVLRQQDRPISIVSNSGVAHVEHSLTLATIADVPRGRIFSAEQVQRPKPHPDVYLHAIRQIGLPSEELVVIEDSEAGVSAARAAGLRVIGFLGASHIFDGHEEKLLDLGAEAVAPDAQALTALLQQY